eukprot:2269292-Prymnesium_polylepis.1
MPDCPSLRAAADNSRYACVCENKQHTRSGCQQGDRELAKPSNAPGSVRAPEPSNLGITGEVVGRHEGQPLSLEQGQAYHNVDKLLGESFVLPFNFVIQRIENIDDLCRKGEPAPTLTRSFDKESPPVTPRAH